VIIRIQIASTRARWAVAAFAAWMAVASPVCALAQPVPNAPEPLNPRVLVVTPAAAPMPALKFRLLPSVADLNPGDAAPIYLRIRDFTGNKPLEEAWNQINTKANSWKNLPLDQFPTTEARKFVDLWHRQLKQIEYGAHRRTCDWNYALLEERLDRVNVLLSDIQSMRQWGRLLTIKMRVEITEGKYDEATRTLETGLAFARHVAEGPFLINGLVGVAIANITLAHLEELIAQPVALNFYWALTALPQPFIGFREELEIERQLLQNLIPELTEAKSDQARTAAEWTSLMSRMHVRILEWSRMLSKDGNGVASLKALSTWDLSQFKTESLPSAREYLKTVHKLAGPQIAAMSDDQVVALYLTGRCDELWDDLFKASYLPPRKAIPLLGAAVKRIQAAESGPLALFVSTVPALEAVMRAELRLDRQIAALRVIEALRIYAAEHNGALPEALDQITEVPVPDDPAIGAPFIYRAADSAAILHGTRAGLPPEPTYRIMIRR
jgi:hypothetical protein